MCSIGSFCLSIGNSEKIYLSGESGCLHCFILLASGRKPKRPPAAVLRDVSEGRDGSKAAVGVWSPERVWPAPPKVHLFKMTNNRPLWFIYIFLKRLTKHWIPATYLLKNRNVGYLMCVSGNCNYYSPGILVMGGDPHSKSHELKSQHRILDGKFVHIPIVVKCVNCIWKNENKWKEAGVVPFLKKAFFVMYVKENWSKTPMRSCEAYFNGLCLQTFLKND